LLTRFNLSAHNFEGDEVPHGVRHFSFPFALASKLAVLPEMKNAPNRGHLFCLAEREGLTVTQMRPYNYLFINVFRNSF